MISYTGAIGATISTPTDLVKIRLQAQVTGSERHSGCIAAFRDIFRSGGIKGLYIGCCTNVLRGMAATGAQVTYL